MLHLHYSDNNLMYAELSKPLPNTGPSWWRQHMRQQDSMWQTDNNLTCMYVSSTYVVLSEDLPQAFVNVYEQPNTYC